MHEKMDYGIDGQGNLDDDAADENGDMIGIKLMALLLLIVLVTPMISVAFKVIFHQSDWFQRFTGTPTPVIIKDILYF